MNKLIEISEQIKSLWPATAIGSITAEVSVKESDEELKGTLSKEAEKLRQSTVVEEISQIPQIQAGRKAYKAFGKAPARYRLSSEALLRRSIKGQGMYFVNNIVEINNLVSIQSFHPICAFDREKIDYPIMFRLGKKNEIYHGIGRGELNIENLPVFADCRGALGSPTSDSERVKITPHTTLLHMNIVAFDGKDSLDQHLASLKQLLERYADAKNIEQSIIQ
jgi:DNA/RNA-binding domain of Phe-tRNA-synthetase-like protein